MVFLSRLLRAEVCKQSLLSLRKSTGHSFQHCKKALELSNNDMKQAVAWLDAEALKQGWTKLERAEARAAQQGVFALAGRGGNLVAVTEVNCETDFVARNSELRGFAHKISETLCEVRKDNSSPSANIQTLSWEKLSQLILDGQSVEEGRARLVAKVGEKVGLRQSVVVAAGAGERLAASCHPDAVFGKYGAVMLYKGGDNEVAEKICRHIIGMKPLSIGKMEDVQEELSQRDEIEEVQAKSTETSGGDENANEADEVPKSKPGKDDEQRLLCQDFVFNPDTTVGELLEEHGMEITKFWRFECAQEVIENKD